MLLVYHLGGRVCWNGDEKGVPCAAVGPPGNGQATPLVGGNAQEAFKRQQSCCCSACRSKLWSGLRHTT